MTQKAASQIRKAAFLFRKSQGFTPSETLTTLYLKDFKRYRNE
jgi:hypothetical protein